jgi:hypothetical protein
MARELRTGSARADEPNSAADRRDLRAIAPETRKIKANSNRWCSIVTSGTPYVRHGGWLENKKTDAANDHIYRRRIHL